MFVMLWLRAIFGKKIDGYLPSIVFMAKCHYHGIMNSLEKPQPRQSEDKYVVRFPSGMRDRLKDAAHANGRSMNAEIVARLQQSFEPTTRMHQSFVSLADPGALQQQLDTTAKSLRLHENAMLIMHGLLRAALREMPPEMDESTTLQIIKSFLRASDEQNMEQARKAWDELMAAGDPTVLLVSRSVPPHGGLIP